MILRTPRTVRLISRNNVDHTGRFRELANAIAALKVPTLILDGEVSADHDVEPVDMQAVEGDAHGAYMARLVSPRSSRWNREMRCLSKTREGCASVWTAGYVTIASLAIGLQHPSRRLHLDSHTKERRLLTGRADSGPSFRRSPQLAFPAFRLSRRVTWIERTLIVEVTYS